MCSLVTNRNVLAQSLYKSAIVIIIIIVVTIAIGFGVAKQGIYKER